MKIIKVISENKDRLRLFLTSGLNQAISSGTNFIINLYLVSVFAPENFGIYGVGFAVILFVGGIGNALFLTQMVVIYPTKKQNDQSDFIKSVLDIVLLFSCFLFLISFLFIFLFSLFSFEYYISKGLIIAIIFASVMYLLKEFYIRTAYNYRKETVAVYIHTSIIITAILLYMIAKFLIEELDTTMAFIIYGISHFIGILIGSNSFKMKSAFTANKKLKLVFKELWMGGKWASLTNVVYTLRSQAHTIIALLIIGPVGVGNLNAARLFITPAVMIIPVVSQLAMPRLSTLRETNKSSLFIKGRFLTILYLAFGLIYSSILLLSYDSIINNFLNKSYGDLFWLTFLWCTYAIMLALRNGQDIIAQVLQKFKILSLINFISAGITLVAAYVLSKTFGLNGILIGLIIGEFFLILMLFLIMKKEKLISKSFL